MRKTKNIGSNDSSGQAMILTTVMLGGLMLSVTAIAGLLMFYQLRQANDAAASGIAVFAADTGLEAGLNCYYQTLQLSTSPDFNINKYCPISGSLPASGATFSSSLKFTPDPNNQTKIGGFELDSFGFAGQTERATQNTFSNQL